MSTLSQVASQVVESVELRTSVTPPLRLTFSGGAGGPSWLLELLKPTVTVRGPVLGSITVAPGGAVGQGGALVGGLLLLGLLAVPFALGVAVGRL